MKRENVIRAFRLKHDMTLSELFEYFKPFFDRYGVSLCQATVNLWNLRLENSRHVSPLGIRAKIVKEIIKCTYDELYEGRIVEERRPSELSQAVA